MPPGEQHADRDVGHLPPLDRRAQGVDERLLPVLRRRPVRVGPVASEGRLPVVACHAVRPSASTTRTVAGGSLRTPLRMVRGAGTTEWKVM